MLKKIVCGVFATLLVASTLILTMGISQTRFGAAESSLWYVGPLGNFSRIQEAIDDGRVKDNDVIEVIEKSTPYYENVTVHKSLGIRRFSGQTYYPTVDGGNGKGTVFNVTASNVEITGFTIQNGYCGIVLSNDSATIANNTITSNVYGMLFTGSSNDMLRDNKMTDNNRNFGVSGTDLSHFIHDIDDSNTVNGKPIHYLVNRHNEEVPSDAGYVAVVNSTDITMDDVQPENNVQGVLVAHSSRIVLENLTFSLISAVVDKSVELVNSSYCTIQDLTITDDDGISLIRSDCNKIRRNTFSRLYGLSVLTAISLDESDDNLIMENAVTGLDCGVILRSSRRNAIVGNNMSDVFFGVHLNRSNSSIFFHNSFTNCINCMQNITSYDNEFDNGYEGNHWGSEYIGEDDDGDGIGDDPHPITGSCVDNHPLMEPWSSLRSFSRKTSDEINPIFMQQLFTSSNSTLCPQASLTFSRSTRNKGPYGWDFSEGMITLIATSGYDGFLDIAIPRDWLDGNYTVLLNGTETDNCSFTMNSTHTSFHITYEPGRHTIQIVGEAAGNIVGDLNGDGIVDIFDVVIITSNYDTKER